MGREDIRDARLVEAVRDGDARAFELLYERHHGPILSFCRHLTGRLEDAEDAVQHTFLSAYREITGSADELDLKPWLYTVALNRCLSRCAHDRARGIGARSVDGASRPRRAGRGVLGPECLAVRSSARGARALVADLGQLSRPTRAALFLSELRGSQSCPDRPFSMLHLPRSARLLFFVNIFGKIFNVWWRFL